MQDPLALPECMTCVRDGGCNLSCIRFYHSSVPCQQTLTSQLTYHVPLLHEDRCFYPLAESAYADH